MNIRITIIKINLMILITIKIEYIMNFSKINKLNVFSHISFHVLKIIKIEIPRS